MRQQTPSKDQFISSALWNGPPQMTDNPTSSNESSTESESDDGSLVELTMEVPGVAAEDLSVEIEDGDVLHVRGGRIVREGGSSAQSEFDQAFQLDEDIDVENIEVTLASGILTVSAPRKEKEEPKRIKIQVQNKDGASLQVEATKKCNEEDSRVEKDMDDFDILEEEDVDTV